MKRLNSELLALALLCLVLGAVVIGIALFLYSSFHSLPPLANTPATIETLTQMYTTAEFRYAPCAGAAFIVVGLLLLRNWMRRKSATQ